MREPSKVRHSKTKRICTSKRFNYKVSENAVNTPSPVRIFPFPFISNFIPIPNPVWKLIPIPIIISPVAFRCRISKHDSPGDHVLRTEMIHRVNSKVTMHKDIIKQLPVSSLCSNFNLKCYAETPSYSAIRKTSLCRCVAFQDAVSTAKSDIFEKVIFQFLPIPEISFPFPFPFPRESHGTRGNSHELLSHLYTVSQKQDTKLFL